MTSLDEVKAALESKDSREIALIANQFGPNPKHTRSMLRGILNVSRKDAKRIAAEAHIANRLAVMGTATVRIDGETKQRPVRLYDKPPGWWNQAYHDQRREWLVGYFRRQLKLRPEDELINVEVRIGC